MGQVLWLSSQCSMHSLWNICPHLMMAHIYELGPGTPELL